MGSEFGLEELTAFIGSFFFSFENVVVVTSNIAESPLVKLISPERHKLFVGLIEKGGYLLNATDGVTEILVDKSGVDLDVGGHQGLRQGRLAHQ